MTIEPSIPLGRRRKREFVVRDFFEMGLEESASPFLTPLARRISRNLPLKVAIFSAFVLLLAYIVSFIPNKLIFSWMLLAAVYVMVGVPALIDAVEDVFLRRDCNIDVLMTLAAFLAIFMGSSFEGGLLLVLFALSGAMEDAVTLKAKNALLQLHRLVPLKAYVLEGGELKERAVQDVPLQSLVLVRAGEVVPLDGVIVEGASSVNMVHLTGESVPVRKMVGDEIPSGARVIDGSLTVRVTHTSSDSTVSRIVELITQARGKKPVLERWFDRFSRSYALTIIGLSLLVAIALPLFIPMEYFGREGSVYRSLAFLITASPCALILAVPIAYLSALGAAARKGIVLKGGTIFDALNRSFVVAFDKTGTLTLGELTLDEIIGAEDPKELLAIAAALERNAVHPVAKAIMKKCQQEGIQPLGVDEVKVIPGSGVEGKVNNTRAFIGDISYAPQLIDQEAVKRLQSEGKIVACLTFGQKGYLLAFSDKPRPKVKEMLQNLKNLKRKILMLTGDHYESAKTIASLVGIEHFEADLKPEDKLKRIEELSETSGLAMVGDGINDAPALARSTVGICMGQVGSATARGAADVILLHDNIELLDWLFIKAEKTKKIVIQNLCIAIVAIIAGSIPALCGFLPLWLAVIVHEGGTVLVGLNAIRLLKE